jgi:uncharacterized protein
VAQRPIPVPTAETRPFWTAAAGNELWLPRCRSCHVLSYPPPPRCPRCLVDDFTWEKLSGTGRLKSWTTIHIDVLPGVEPPFTIGEVELAEQADLFMVAHIVGTPAEMLKTDAVVELSFVASDADKKVALPEFRLLQGPRTQTEKRL